MSENDELLNIPEESWNKRGASVCYSEPPALASSERPERMSDEHSQWASFNGTIFRSYPTVYSVLPPGVYEADCDNRGMYLQKVPVNLEGIIKFPHTNFEVIMTEIENFWTLENKFNQFNLQYKRGMLLYGTAGGGKTSLVKLISKDVVEREGIVLKYHVDLGVDALRLVRQIQDTPIVVIMEDIDSLIERNESRLLNLLDGVDDIHKVLFIGTTNYPERLGGRIVNRPSRFDKRFKIGYPTSDSRRLYLESLLATEDKLKERMSWELETWVNDTEKFTFAHLKELFVAVVILGNDYQDSLATLKAMCNRNISSEDKSTQLGF